MDFLLVCRLAAMLYRQRDYFGLSVVASELSQPPSREFAHEFPADLNDYGRDYDQVQGIGFPKGNRALGQPGISTIVEEVDHHTLINPVELVANTLLRQLRDLCAARVDFERFSQHIKLLNDALVRDWSARKGTA